MTIRPNTSTENTLTDIVPIEHHAIQTFHDTSEGSQLQSLHSNAQLQLSFNLQSSLNPDQIMLRFFIHMNQALQCNSLHYQNSSAEIEFASGSEAIHSAEYELSLSQESLGSLKLTRSRLFSDDDIAYIEDSICVLLYPLRNSLYYKRALELATQDMLTGAGNRISFDKAIVREMEISRRHELPFSLLAVDIDHFKAINDEHGHAAGDYALRAVSKTIAKVIRKSDSIYRIGGDEFTLILGTTKQRGATILAKRLCDEVNKTKYAYQGQRLDITVSIGVAVYDNESRAELCEKADQALYRAKHKGRNRIST